MQLAKKRYSGEGKADWVVRGKEEEEEEEAENICKIPRFAIKIYIRVIF